MDRTSEADVNGSKIQPDRITTIASWLILLFFAGIVLLGLWLLYQVGVRLAGWLSAVDAPIAASVVTASATLLVGVVTVVGGRLLEAKISVQREQRERKIPIYVEFIDWYFNYTFKRDGKPLEGEEARAFLEEFTKKILVWGSDDVVTAWVQFRMKSRRVEKANNNEILDSLENIFRQMRKDLGHKNKGLARGDLLRLFINDM